jgi:hypothetical protein
MHNPGDPMVSVIIPTYNRAHVLGRAVRRVLNQAYQDFGWVVIRDGPTDGRCKGSGISRLDMAGNRDLKARGYA